MSYILLDAQDVTLVMWVAAANTLTLDVKSTWKGTKNSSIFKHLNNNKECKMASNNDSFKILDSARSAYELAI